VPDGYTLIMTAAGPTAINVSLYSKIPFDPIRDFAPVALVASTIYAVVVNPSVPAKSMKELVALGKSGKPLTYASGGTGSAPHLSGELLQMVAGVDLIHVPFKGAGPGIAAVLGSQVTMMFVGPLGIEGHVKSGKLRALAVADRKRSAILPDVPTVTEAGYPGVEGGTWYGFVAPAGTARPIIDAFHAAVLKAMTAPDTKSRLLAQGVEIVGGGPGDFDRLIREEIVKWTKLVQHAGIKPN